MNRHVAIHESAHAVIAAACDVAIEFVTIEPAADRSGYVQLREPLAYVDVEHVLQIYLAGGVGEQVILGSKTCSDADDLTQARQLVTSCYRDEIRRGATVDGLIAAHRAVTLAKVLRLRSHIERLACALERRKTIPGRDVPGYLSRFVMEERCERGRVGVDGKESGESVSHLDGRRDVQGAKDNNHRTSSAR